MGRPFRTATRTVLTPSHRSGVSMSGAGDVNGDGVDDSSSGQIVQNQTAGFLARAMWCWTNGWICATLEHSDFYGMNGFVLNDVDTGDFSGCSAPIADPSSMQPIMPGADWREIRGDRIEAREGGGTYYLYGTDRSSNNQWFKGVNMYSTDLVHWKLKIRSWTSTLRTLKEGRELSNHVYRLMPVIQD